MERNPVAYTTCLRHLWYLYGSRSFHFTKGKPMAMFNLYAVPTSVLELTTEENYSAYERRISAITDFYVSDTGTQCASILFDDGTFDSVLSSEIRVEVL